MNFMSRKPGISSDDERTMALKTRVLELFRNRTRGNMAADLYTNGGGDKYAQILTTNEDYMPFNEEIGLIQASKDEIAKWAEDIDTVIIVGPGPAQAIRSKELAILEKMPQIKTVKLIDLSAQFNEQAVHAIETNVAINRAANQRVNVESYTGDFRTININENYNRALVITTGSLTNFENAPTDNFPSSIASSYMAKFAELAKSGGKIVWGYDTNQGKTSLESEYNTPEIEDFILNPLRKLARLDDVALKVDGFKYTPEFFPRGSHLAHWWEATEDQIAKIEDENVPIFKGDRYLCFSSIKLQPDKLTTLANAQGIKTSRVFESESRTQALHCFNCN